MRRIISIDEFISFRKTITDMPEDKTPCLVFSAGTCGQASGANDIIRLAKRYILEKKLHDQIHLRITGCLGFCEIEPLILIEPDNYIYPGINAGDVADIIDATIKGEVIEELFYREDGSNMKYPTAKDIPFIRNQTQLLLENNQKLDPIRIFNYISTGGYAGFEKVISNPDPDGIINEIKEAELRGRGGAGFPTGLKWEIAKKAGGNSLQKYLVCNADEGDPGAYMDRNLLEGNPHSIIEGMIIAGIAIGADKGFIYVRAEYPLAIKHASIARRQAYDLGILGKNILESQIDFDLEIIRGAGAFVCGEETALIKSIEGEMAHPKQRPPYPVNQGIWGYPTCINNVETLANVPVIIGKGAREYKKVGIPGSRGTKIFSLVGKIKNTGLVEVPFGTTLREIVYKIGGGPQGDARLKAIQTGGPSGGCIPEKMFDLPIDYDSLNKAGSIMGSGGMIVMDEHTCMVDIARYFTKFLQEESCGKCSTCREGTQRITDIVTNITQGRGKSEDLKLLEELGQVMKDASMCGLGQTAANPLLATLKYFKEEYIEHIEKKTCRAVVCKEIISSPCQFSCPIDTEVSVYVALIAHKRYEEALEIIKKENPFASVLARVCHHPCESWCKAGEGGDPIAIRDLKRFVTDYGIKHKLCQTTEPVKKTNGIKIAIVGSGPSGLTCGFYLAKKGYEVTVFEKEKVIGGMLAMGIPEYRLPREILEYDLNYIRSAGIEIKTNTALGKDFTIDSLFEQGYKALFLATGSHKSLNLGIKDEHVEGVLPGMKALASLNLGEKIDLGKRVGIIGGGNTAVDAARRILRAEASESVAMVDAARRVLRTTTPESVTIFYRRTIDEIPAYEEEVEGAQEEGITIEFLTAPKRIIAENGKLKACEFLRMKLGEVDESGRRRPIPIRGSEFIVELDTLIVSISESPDISFLQDTGLEFSKWGTVVIDPGTCLTKREGVFAGGDLVTGPNTVVNAVASGKIAAESIEQYVSGKEIKREYKITRPSRYIEPVEFSEDQMAELLTAGRSRMPTLSPEKRKYNLIEVCQGLPEELATQEAKRCLRCELETEEGKLFLDKLQENKPLTEVQK
ncbi:MAG: FAD-dependent oxidoreductase [Bacteroidales bacterium]|nr:MAG: FAD-dependent oxidoreductase [Bacteroidales bacterium]